MQEVKAGFIFAGIGEDYRKKMNLFQKKQLDRIHELSKQANQEFGIDIYGYLTVDDEEQHDNLTVWSAIYTCDYVIYQSYREAGIVPNVFLGYSMGLITALVCGEAIGYLDGIRILKAILRYHVAKQPEGMATIIGFNIEQLNGLFVCHEIKNVDISCINNEVCLVVSGLKEDVEKAVDMAMENGCMKVNRIQSEFAFHTGYFKEGVEILEECVAGLEVKDLSIPLLSSITQEYLVNSDALRKELVKNMFSKMYWKNSIETATKDNVKKFYEVSLAKGLTKCSRIIDLDSKFYAFNNVASLWK